MPRIVRRLHATVVVTALAFAAACDDDPNDPNPDFSVTCPTQNVGVDQPIVFNLNGQVAPASVVQGNVVVSNAVTGVEIPGALSFTSAPGQSSVTFTPGEQLAFQTTFRVRVQNLTTTGNVPQQSVIVCDVRTPPPPITELFWRPLPSAGGGSLRGGSLPTAQTGFVAQLSQPFFRRDNTVVGGEFVALPNIPYYTNFFDVAFVDASRGFVTLGEPRESRTLIGESFDGGATFTTLANVGNQAVTRLFFRRVAPGEQGIFGVAGGGRLPFGNLFKYNSQTKLFSTFTINNTNQVSDIDFASDTLKGVATTFGVQVGTLDQRGRVVTSNNGGTTFTEIPGSVAPSDVQTYTGVAIRNNGHIFVTGANGYAAHLTPGTGGAYTTARVLQGVIPNLDPNNNLALQYTDVQFLPNNDAKGWIIGLQQTGVQNGIPRLRGLIFETRDGGNTWTRQGVPGAPDFGAEFPALNRIVISPDGAKVWLLGEGGTVLEYTPTSTTP